MSIEVGTVVRLKSGSLPMTVVEVPENGGDLTCDWYDEDMDHNSSDFPLAALVEYGAEKAQSDWAAAYAINEQRKTTKASIK